MMPDIEWRETTAASRDFQELCRNLDQWLNQLAGGSEKRQQYIPYNQIDGLACVVVGYQQGRAIACGALRRISPVSGEVKRVYIHEEIRGCGVGHQLMTFLEKRGRELGYTSLCLETGAALQAAMTLYRSRGYCRIANYGPYINMPASICLAKVL